MIRKARSQKSEARRQKPEDRSPKTEVGFSGFSVFSLLFSAFCLLVSVFCPLALSYAKEVTILYTGQTHAMLYPCSCPIQQDGGVARRASLVKELRKKDPWLLLLDCGNFTAAGLMDEYTQSTQLDMQRSEVNFKSMELMKYDAVGIGSDEFNFGKDFFLKNAKRSTPAYLSANLDTDQVIPYLIKDNRGVKIGIIGLTGASAAVKAEGLKISLPEETGKLAGELKKQGVAVVIILSTLGEKEDLKLIANVKGIDIIFIGQNPLKQESMTKVDSTFLLRPAWQARKLGQLTLEIQDNKLLNCKVDELRLSDKIADDLNISAILPRCYADVNCKGEGGLGFCQNPGTKKASCSFIRPNKVNLTVIGAKDCLVCNVEPVVSFLKNKFPGIIPVYLNYPEIGAKKMIKDLLISGLPAYILGKEVEKEDNFESMKNDLQLINAFYVYKPQAGGISYFLNQTQKKGNFDLFFSIFQKDAVLLLTTIKEFNPSLHFLTAQKHEGPLDEQSLGEEEEYLRAVCVQKYYPEKFWDYLICRAKHIKSVYWEDCLGGLDTQSVKTCARGAIGVTLLKENTSLNKQLQVFSGPSYLLDNQQIFSSRGVPSQEELRKILKK